MSKKHTIESIINEILENLDMENKAMTTLMVLVHRIELYDSNILGMSKKRIVLEALAKVRETLSDDRKDDFDKVIQIADELVDHFVFMANHAFKSKRKKCCLLLH